MMTRWLTAAPVALIFVLTLVGCTTPQANVKPETQAEVFRNPPEQFSNTYPRQAFNNDDSRRPSLDPGGNIMRAGGPSMTGQPPPSARSPWPRPPGPGHLAAALPREPSRARGRDLRGTGHRLPRRALTRPLAAHLPDVRRLVADHPPCRQPAPRAGHPGHRLEPGWLEAAYIGDPPRLAERQLRGGERDIPPGGVQFEVAQGAVRVVECFPMESSRPRLIESGFRSSEMLAFMDPIPIEIARDQQHGHGSTYP